MPFGGMVPGPGFPMPKPGEDAKKPQGQGEGQSQPEPPGYPFMTPWGPYDPRMIPGMFPQEQPHHTDQQPHSGPPPPYNGNIPDGSVPDHPDLTRHDSQTAEKVAPDDLKLSELKEPVVAPDVKGMFTYEPLCSEANLYLAAEEIRCLFADI